MSYDEDHGITLITNRDSTLLDQETEVEGRSFDVSMAMNPKGWTVDILDYVNLNLIELIDADSRFEKFCKNFNEEITRLQVQVNSHKGHQEEIIKEDHEEKNLQHREGLKPGNKRKMKE
ncbi:hypothetical protein C2G38_2224826 [Gigaspora rosea]|uniref:Uncharacterized protein n=1 Tax=Gigaspora rosea TaxID=44941 RepID=A0A397U005_9GLOM|nr:hypothetical protein C2G38_2224826 [Gigaspora rosea]